MVLEPPPVLQLVREERIASMGPLIRQPDGGDVELAPRWQAPSRDAVPDDDEPEAAGDAEPQDEAEPEADEDVDYDEVIDADGIARVVVVPRRRFTTHEDLARAAIRDAEPRRPRVMYVARLLLRTAGPVCDCDGDLEERARVRAAMTAMVEHARPAVKACLSAEMAEDPRVIVKAPALLVVAQAKQLGNITYRLSPSFDVGGRGIVLRELGWQGEASPALHECLAQAFAEAYVPDGASLATTHRVQLPLVAFVQPPWGINLGNTHDMLAMYASVLGWLHYERGEYEHALEFFRDAWWVFHLEEYKYLEGLAHEQLGDREQAADAFEVYLAARPYAPEAGELPQRIARLRGPETPQFTRGSVPR